MRQIKQKNTAKSFQMDMTDGPILKQMLSFALPLMCSGILQILFNAADVVVVGKFAGDSSLAAVGSNSALINLITNLFIGLSVGANVVVAQYYGAKQTEDVVKSVHTSICLGLISGVFLTVIGVIGAPFFLALMQTPPEVIEKASLYLRIFFLGMTATMVYNFGSAVLRAVGDTKRPLYFLLGSGLLNVILNLIFVIPLKMDVVGVALATIISQMLSAFLVLRCLAKEDSIIRLDIKKLKVDSQKMRQIIRVGLPAGGQGVVFALSNTVIQSSVNGFGAIVMAGNAAAQTVEGIVYFAMNAFYQSAISFVSQNYGAKRFDRIKRIIFCGQFCVIFAGSFCGMLLLAFGAQVLGIYSDSAEVIAAGMVRLKVILSTYYLCGMMDVMVGILRGLGFSVMPMVTSLIGACGLRLVWLATVFQLPQFHTQKVIYLSYPVSWLITFGAHIVCYFIKARPKMRAEEKLAETNPQ